jgi:hypothetical protein
MRRMASPPAGPATSFKRQQFLSSVERDCSQVSVTALTGRDVGGPRASIDRKVIVMRKLVLHKALVLAAALAVGSACIANDALAKGGGGGGGGGGHMGGGHIGGADIGSAHFAGNYGGGRGHVGGGDGHYAGNFDHGRHGHDRIFLGAGYGLPYDYGYDDYAYGYGDSCWQTERVRVGGHLRWRVNVCD